jgi:trans-2,3-dihydro-3-hydroxyanthranilate isomerase
MAGRELDDAQLDDRGDAARDGLVSDHSYVVADVFTDVPLAGNPVAVFTDATGLGAELMQPIARELNLSETVFLTPGDGERADVRARIFTPTVELPFAGHPVLGAAFVVGERSTRDEVRIETAGGVIPVALTRRGGAVVHGEMLQPIPTWEPYDRVADLLAALGLDAADLPVTMYDNGPRHLMVAVADASTVTGLRPDLRALAALGACGVSCLALTGSTTVRTRMFAPGMGVAEDPATGSAAGPLALHLARHGWIAFGQPIEISQGSEIGRPSTLSAVVTGSADAVRSVRVGGAAVIVARAEMALPEMALPPGG